MQTSVIQEINSPAKRVIFGVATTGHKQGGNFGSLLLAHFPFLGTALYPGEELMYSVVKFNHIR